MTAFVAFQIGLGGLLLATVGTMFFTSHIARKIPSLVVRDSLKGLDRMFFAGMAIGLIAAVRLILTNDVSDLVAVASSATAIAVFPVVLLIFTLRVVAISRAADMPPAPHAIRAVGETVLMAALVGLFHWLGWI
ncbi:hypothetical protein ILP92_00755 [Maribius pontilimi]|uniref:Uncharacterized protein n=1 Tax=Palleronia pontilimi TaxID=1964209 RepID=A0A934MCI0_9RHOB|nr:hypothetical protein [Palleronia pontilimi]MBJ3761281.1 hypothetical protein [Palleronia pontilimi]